MPIYSFRCDECGVVFDDFRMISDRNSPAKCKCGGSARRSFIDEQPHTHRDYDKPVLSDAMGCHPDQVKQHRKLFPDIPITNDGRIVVTSHSEHRRIMKRLGFHDRAGYN